MQRKNKLLDRVICIIVSLLIFSFSVLPFHVSADVLPVEYSDSDFFLQGFKYTSDMYTYYEEKRDVLDLDNYSGFFFKYTNGSYSYLYLLGGYNFRNTNDVRTLIYINQSDSNDRLYNITSSIEATGPFYKFNSVSRITNAQGNISYGGAVQAYFKTNGSYTYPLVFNQENLSFLNCDTFHTSTGASKSIEGIEFIPVGLQWKNLFQKLTFTVTPELTENMNMSSLANNFTIDVDNPTSKNYNYLIYISSSSANLGIVNSLNNLSYILSSQQWCYIYQQDYTADTNLVDMVSNSVSTEFRSTDIIDYVLHGTQTSLFNFWGGTFNGLKSYVSLKNSSMSFYTLCQTKCPVYLIKKHDSKSHVINYSALNLNLNSDYYLNILYYEPKMSIVGAIGAAQAALLEAAGTGTDLYPIYNSSFFRDYSVYSSTKFSFVDGVFSLNSDDMTGYNDVIKYSDPGNSAATISSDDNSVNINNSGGNSYDSSVKTVYTNYGTIYHGCNFYYGSNSPSNGNGTGLGDGNTDLSLPDVSFDLIQFDDSVNNYKSFCSIAFDCLPVEIWGLIALALGACIVCRILGR